MSSPPPSDRAALARARLAARGRRIALLRRRVVAATLATFVLAWGAIVWSGTLGRTATAQVTARAAATTTPDTTSSGDDGTTWGDDGAGSGSSSGDGAGLSSGAAPDLSTGQS